MVGRWRGGAVEKLDAPGIRLVEDAGELDSHGFARAGRALQGLGAGGLVTWVAAELLRRGVVERIIVVAPTEHLKTQWADAAARVGIRLDPRFSNRQRTHAR